MNICMKTKIHISGFLSSDLRTEVYCTGCNNKGIWRKSTSRRSFNVADTPGHEEHGRGASFAVNKMDLVRFGQKVYSKMSTPLEESERRDVKDLYKKARNGQIPNFTGISSRMNCRCTLRSIPASVHSKRRRTMC